MDSSQEQLVCSICLKFESDVSPNWFVSTPKGHVFHFNGCLQARFDSGNLTCPLCEETIHVNSLTRVYGVYPSSIHQGSNHNVLDTNGIRSAKPAASTRRHEYSENPDYKFKIVLIGDASVGKSSLMERYLYEEFRSELAPTILDFASKKIEVGGKQIRMQLWDTSGNERFKALAQNYVRNAHGVVLTYSYGDIRSFESIKAWLDLVYSSALPGVAIFLVGNKIDIPEDQQSVTTEEGQDVASRSDLQFFETSAKDGCNVDAVFRALAIEILERIDSKQLEYRDSQYDGENTVQLQAEKESDVSKTQNRKCWC